MMKRRPSPRPLLGAPFLALVLSASACERARAPSEESARLADGVVAEVAGRIVTGEMVVRAAPQGAALETVAARLVTAELLAAYLHEEEPALARVAERAALARGLLSELRNEALKAGGPVTPAETEEVVRARWVEYARPRSVRTVHAVALPGKPEHREAARALAERVVAAAEGTTDPNAFADRVRPLGDDPALPKGVELRVEALPPVAEDGRTVAVDALDAGGPPTLVTEYAKAAARLTAVGQQSPVVETQFGYHVLLALEILPELQPSASDAARSLREEAISVRTRPRHEELLSTLRAAAHIEVARNATELTRAVEITR